MFKEWTSEELGRTMNLGFPIILTFLAIISLFWFFYEVKKKRIELKSMITWLIFNILYTISIIYILIITCLHAAFFDVPNLFNMFSHYAFGLDIGNGKQWVILLIFAFISLLLILMLKHSIKINRNERRIDELNKQVAILMGQVNKTADFEKLPLAVREKTLRDHKKEMKEKIKMHKVTQRTKEKIDLLSDNTSNIKKRK